MYVSTKPFPATAVALLLFASGTAFAHVTAPLTPSIAPAEPISPNTAPTVNDAPNTAPTVAPTTTVSPTVALPKVPATPVVTAPAVTKKTQ